MSFKTGNKAGKQWGRAFAIPKSKKDSPIHDLAAYALPTRRKTGGDKNGG